ncbi:ZIP family metal transporter [Bacteroidetes bacterium endosymbiont of Geopemphigus sp.]|uniref:ZIP family metal transporter n=1 Tax=Bacteroidetes bacterium endosymbiont of Geopemphigus sp. TaxID=2047937 RepID=UPI0022441FE3|nr:ZIP family metal transporter [Bacteroidetes bacterium endosymbiont of Geopemphigus sp.]
MLLLSIIIGLILAYQIKARRFSADGLLSFSSVYLLGTVFNHLFPEVYGKEDQGGVGFFVLSGILVQVLLETITKGIEHGHIHSKGRSPFPYGIFLGLFAHSLLEAMAIHQDHHGLLYAILIHKIPVAAILYFFLTDALESKKRVLFWMGIFALSAPLGIWIGELPLLSRYETYVNAFVAGIFIHIATVIWFESSSGHKINSAKLLLFFLGIALSYIFS